MIIYLRHPVHGTKVATSDLEVDHDEGHGWERFEPEAQVVVEEVALAQEEVAPVNTLEVKSRRRKSA